MTASFRKELSSQLQHMRTCRGAKECFLKASQPFSVRRVRAFYSCKKSIAKGSKLKEVQHARSNLL